MIGRIKAERNSIHVIVDVGAKFKKFSTLLRQPFRGLTPNDCENVYYQPVRPRNDPYDETYYADNLIAYERAIDAQDDANNDAIFRLAEVF